ARQPQSRSTGIQGTPRDYWPLATAARPSRSAPAPSGASGAQESLVEAHALLDGGEPEGQDMLGHGGVLEPGPHREILPLVARRTPWPFSARVCTPGRATHGPATVSARAMRTAATGRAAQGIVVARILDTRPGISVVGDPVARGPEIETDAG